MTMKKHSQQPGCSGIGCSLDCQPEDGNIARRSSLHAAPPQVHNSARITFSTRRRSRLTFIRQHQVADLRTECAYFPALPTAGTPDLPATDRSRTGEADYIEPQPAVEAGRPAWQRRRRQDAGRQWRGFWGWPCAIASVLESETVDQTSDRPFLNTATCLPLQEWIGASGRGRSPDQMPACRGNRLSRHHQFTRRPRVAEKPSLPEASPLTEVRYAPSP